MTAPPMAYYGGKTTLARRIVELLPKHEHYVEPFAGSLAVLLAKPPSKMETVNDLDGDLMHFWRILRDRPSELIRACALTPHSRAEHDAAYTDSDDDLERARSVWIRVSQGRTGTLRRTGWRHYVDPAGSGASLPTYLDGYVDRMAAAAERLHRVSLECRPANELIQSYAKFDTVCLYLDPPYLGSLRSRNYRTEMTDEGAHTELLDLILACKASVVMSGYASPLYDEALTGWSRVEIPALTGQSASGCGDRTEVLWSNRDITPTPMLDFGEAS